MKKSAAILSICWMLLSILPVHAEEPSPSPSPEAPSASQPAVSVDAPSAILIDLASGTVLFEKNADEQMDPASLTKIMTVRLAVEHLNPSQTLRMSNAAYQTYSHDYGVMWFQLGEELSAEECEYAAMLASANDAAAMLAEAVSLTQDNFIAQMNAEANTLGMTHTKFDNIFGTHSETNYSTARDLARLVQNSVENDAFAKIFGSAGYTISATNKQSEKRAVANDLELLRSGDYYNELVTGGKIGSTTEGGYCAAVTGKKEDSSVAAVVLGEESADAAYHDIDILLDYGFSSYQTVTITPEEIGTRTVPVYDGKKHTADVTFSVDSGFSALMPAGISRDDLTFDIIVQNEDSLDPEEITAQVVFLLDGKEAGRADMERSIQTYDTSFAATAWPKLKQVLNYISIGVLAFVACFRGLAKFIRSFQPPQE